MADHATALAAGVLLLRDRLARVDDKALLGQRRAGPPPPTRSIRRLMAPARTSTLSGLTCAASARGSPPPPRCSPPGRRPSLCAPRWPRAACARCASPPRPNLSNACAVPLAANARSRRNSAKRWTASINKPDPQAGRRGGLLFLLCCRPGKSRSCRREMNVYEQVQILRKKIEPSQDFCGLPCEKQYNRQMTQDQRKIKFFTAVCWSAFWDDGRRAFSAGCARCRRDHPHGGGCGRVPVYNTGNQRTFGQ